MFIAKLSKTVSSNWILLALSTYICYFLTTAIYNLYFSPLAKYPGPFLAKISALPNWWYSCIGRRHVWTWKLHRKYGEIIRTTPNKILFNSAQAYKDIHGPKANCYKTIFYKAWRRREENVNTLNCVDRSVHARKRRILNMAFNEKSLREAEVWVGMHVGRWTELLLGAGGGEGDMDGDGKGKWTKGRNMADQSNYLFFDIMADLSFGKSWDIKEKGENGLRGVPGLIHSFVDFSWVIGTSPLLPLFLYLKPRGIDYLLERFTPESVRSYHSFVKSSIESRLALSSKQSAGPEGEVRKDLFHYIINAKDPEAGLKYSREEVGAEAGLLIVAGSDTAAVTLSGIFYYLTRRENREAYEKLCQEVRSTFDSTDEIRLRGNGEGKEGKLGRCVYLKAVIEESLRMCPPISSDLPRITLKGGAEIDGVFVEGDVEVGVNVWSLHFNERYFGDPWKFKPERWIVGRSVGLAGDIEEGVSEEEVERAKSAFFPFSYGRGDCVGKRLAMMELLVIVGRVVWGMDFEAVDEEDVMDGKEKWRGDVLEREKGLYPVKDMFIAKREGPVVRFRKRVV